MSRADVEFAGYGASNLLGFFATEIQNGLPLSDLNRGNWFLVSEFEGGLRSWEFGNISKRDFVPTVMQAPLGYWDRTIMGSWQSDMTASEYQKAIIETQEAIYQGDVYQANICRMLVNRLLGKLPIKSASTLHHLLEKENPAPYGGYIEVESEVAEENIWLVSASPELFFELDWENEKVVIRSGPIKGTAVTATGLTAKDEAENIMITDLVRNDLQRICLPGSVEVEKLLDVEEHPGLVHLVSTVAGVVDPKIWSQENRWKLIMEALFPPASVSGAPKLAALEVINGLEKSSRGPYCGGIGWILNEKKKATLAVGIRTFFADAERSKVFFGTGAGITSDSDPVKEWQETQLKANKLINLIGGMQND